MKSLMSFVYLCLIPTPQFNCDAKRAVLSGADEDDHMDDERDVNRTQQGDGFDLFEEEGNGSHSGTNGSHRQNGDSGDTHCGLGQNLLLDELFIGHILQRWPS